MRPVFHRKVLDDNFSKLRVSPAGHVRSVAQFSEERQKIGPTVDDVEGDVVVEQKLVAVDREFQGRAGPSKLLFYDEPRGDGDGIKALRRKIGDAIGFCVFADVRFSEQVLPHGADQFAMHIRGKDMPREIQWFNDYLAFMVSMTHAELHFCDVDLVSKCSDSPESFFV